MPYPLSSLAFSICTQTDFLVSSPCQTLILATAILNRLLHHSTTLNIKGESYRLKEKRKAGLLGQPKPVEQETKEAEVLLPV